MPDFWTESGAVISKNVFYRSRPPGGAISGRSENLGQRFIVGIQGVSVQSLASTGLTVPEVSW